MTTFWLGICRRFTAISTAATTPKSPHPGHHVGFVSDFPMRGNAPPVGVGITRALLSAMVHLLEPPGDDLVGIEGLAVVLEKAAREVHPRFGAQESAELAGIVGLHEERAVRAPEGERGRCGVEGVDGREVEEVRRMTLGEELGHGVPD